MANRDWGEHLHVEFHLSQVCSTFQFDLQKQIKHIISAPYPRRLLGRIPRPQGEAVCLQELVTSIANNDSIFLVNYKRSNIRVWGLSKSLYITVGKYLFIFMKRTPLTFTISRVNQCLGRAQIKVIKPSRKVGEGKANSH